MVYQTSLDSAIDHLRFEFRDDFDAKAEEIPVAFVDMRWNTASAMRIEHY